jgi:hypothetical protein
MRKKSLIHYGMHGHAPDEGTDLQVAAEHEANSFARYTSDHARDI